MYRKSDYGFEVVGSKQLWVVSLDMKSCNCPKFKYLLKGQTPCHHMEEVINGERQVKDVSFDRKSYIEPISEQQFIDKYGEETFNQLKLQFEIATINGKVRLL